VRHPAPSAVSWPLRHPSHAPWPLPPATRPRRRRPKMAPPTELPPRAQLPASSSSPSARSTASSPMSPVSTQKSADGQCMHSADRVHHANYPPAQAPSVRNATNPAHMFR
jgi:hypothetical protein